MQAHIDEWKLLKDEVAPEMRDSNLLAMFLAIIPQDYANQLSEDPAVKTFTDALARCEAKSKRLNTARLAQVHQQKREQSVRAGPSVPFVHQVQEAAQPEGPKDQLVEMMKNLSSTVAAALKDNAGRGRDRQRTRSPQRDRSESPRKWETTHA